MAYADVEIRIREKITREVDDQSVSCYPVEITVDGEREFPPGYLDATTQPPNPTDAHYADAEFGQELFGWLFAEQQLSKNWAQIRGAYPQRRLRLRIDADEPGLHQVVWESLCEPPEEKQPQLHLAASSATPFSRYLSGQTPHGKPILSRPIRILVVAPAQVDFEQRYPQDQHPDMALIEPDEEFQALQAVLAPLVNHNLVQLTLLSQPCTLAAIAHELLQGYHVLHLICHGEHSKETHQTRLILADPASKVKPELDTDVTVMLAGQLFEAGVQDENKLRLVFLASCESAKRSSADAYRGLAPQLVYAGVPAVVAMQEHVGEETAREFAAVFYTQLLQHGQVDLAANEARQIVIAAKLPGPVIPVLFLRLKDGRLLDQARGGQDWLQSARAALMSRDFDQALEASEAALSEHDPHEPEAHLLAAVALMRGVGADRLKDSTIKKVERHLEMAANSQAPETAATAWAVWGLVRYDYYYLNRRPMGTPGLAAIRSKLDDMAPAPVEVSVVRQVHASQNARRHFGLG
jgi:hypothetical protein